MIAIGLALLLIWAHQVQGLGVFLGMLGAEPKRILRKNDKVAKEKGLTGDESAGKLIDLMAKHPTLIQRPIGVKGKRAVIGRPIDELLGL